ncbi:MAG: outer membrane protein transport protein, partial [Spongiibacteraceae bacterium]|nr:outer membrane protein transport protein [Spongiibacteraceae bacterium]
MHNRTARRLLAMLVAMQSGSLLAAGFALNEQNASDLGQAFAGRSSMAADATTVFTNPAGMSMLERAEISAGFAGIMSSTDISNVRSPIPGTNKGDPVPTTAIPFAFWSQPLDNGWSVGLGFYVPFGLVTEYESAFQGRYFGTKSELKQLTLQPTVAYRISDQWSVGLGVSYNYIEGELSRNAPHPAIPGGPDVRSRVTGDDSASWGYNVGVLFQPVEGTRIGL